MGTEEVKRCYICGRRVDLRRRGATTLNERTKRIIKLRNPQYQYICSKECLSHFDV